MNEKNPAVASGAALAAVSTHANYNAAPAYVQQFDAQFFEAMQDAGIVPSNPGDIVGDGLIHRFHVEGDKPGSKNGWAVLHLDGVPAGAFGSWKTGTSFSWCAMSRSRMTFEQRLEHRRRIEAARHAAAAVTAERQREAAESAKAIWVHANRDAVKSHPYVIKKGLDSVERLHFVGVRGRELVLPIMNLDYEVTGLQFIDEDGSKRLLAGSAKKGNFIPIFEHNIKFRKVLIICEGWATGVTLAESRPRDAVIAAIDAGNLKPVAQAVRARYPRHEIIIACDNDRNTPGNPGLTKGKEAAAAVNGYPIWPEFPIDAPKHLTDFNDLKCWLVERGQA